VQTARAVRALTSGPFGVNLFAPAPIPPAPDAGRALEKVAPFFAELRLPPPPPPPIPRDAFAQQLAATLETGAAVFSFTFGMLPAGAVEAAKARGMLVAGTRDHRRGGRVALEKTGVDAIVAQGSEAGGHRGSFLRRLRHVDCRHPCARPADRRRRPRPGHRLGRHHGWAAGSRRRSRWALEASSSARRS